MACDAVNFGPFCLIFPLRPLLKLGCLVCRMGNKSAALSVVSQATGVSLSSEEDLQGLSVVQALQGIVALRMS